jgi:hypothetical protein
MNNSQLHEWCVFFSTLVASQSGRHLLLVAQHAASPTMMRGSVLAAPLTHNLHSLKRRLGHGQMDEKWKTIEETWRNMGRI